MFIAYFGGRHFCVDVLAVKFVLRSVTFFPSKICNKHTNIYGVTKEFLHFQNFENFCPPFLGGLWGSCPLFSKLLSSSTGSTYVSLQRHPYATHEKVESPRLAIIYLLMFILCNADDVILRLKEKYLWRNYKPAEKMLRFVSATS